MSILQKTGSSTRSCWVASWQQTNYTHVQWFIAKMNLSGPSVQSYTWCFTLNRWVLWKSGADPGPSQLLLCQPCPASDDDWCQAPPPIQSTISVRTYLVYIRSSDDCKRQINQWWGIKDPDVHKLPLPVYTYLSPFHLQYIRAESCNTSVRSALPTYSRCTRFSNWVRFSMPAGFFLWAFSKPLETKLLEWLYIPMVKVMEVPISE